MKITNIEGEQLKKVLLLSEESEKILLNFSEKLKERNFSFLMGMISKGAPIEVVNALENYHKCNAYFKRYIANKGGC